MEYWNSPEYSRHVERLTAYHESRLVLSLDEALEELNLKYTDLMYLYRRSDIASVLHAHVRGRIRENFHSVRGAYVYDKPPSAFMLILDGHVIGIPVVAAAKFKKQAWNLKTANIQTKAVRDFNSQKPVLLKYLLQIQLVLPIPGLMNRIANQPKGCNLIIGYTPNAECTLFDRLTTSLPMEDGSIKMLSAVTRRAEVGKNIVAMREVEPDKKKADTPVRRVHRRSQDKDASKEADRKYIKPSKQAQHNVIEFRKKKK